MARMVVVIEDDLDAREMVVEALTFEGYDVVSAKNGPEGLARIASLAGRPCLVLLDMMMPAMNGWDVLAALARVHPRPPVVIVSAAKIYGVPAGADSVLEKPIHIDDLLATVRVYAA
jgi:DNA-binding response OmpR family regulator